MYVVFYFVVLVSYTLQGIPLSKVVAEYPHLLGRTGQQNSPPSSSDRQINSVPRKGGPKEGFFYRVLQPEPAFFQSKFGF